MNSLIQRLNKEFLVYMDNRVAPVYSYRTSNNSFFNIVSYNSEYKYHSEYEYIIEDYRFGYVMSNKNYIKPDVRNHNTNEWFSQKERYCNRPHKNNFKLNKTYNFLGINKSMYM